jgi:signal peptide peptidase SppA
MTPFVVLTAHGDHSRALEALSLGAFDFITKDSKRKFVIESVCAALKFGREMKCSKNDPVQSSHLRKIYADMSKSSAMKLKKIIDDSHIKALLVNVNSPGGTVVGSEKIYNILRKISEKKPVVIVMGTMAASGGYLISLGGDYIVSHNGTITGSIGVILQTAEVTELAQKLGIKFNNFKSGELKAVPNPTEKLTEEVRVAIMENIEDTYNFFLELVSERRNLPIEEVKKLAEERLAAKKKKDFHETVFVRDLTGNLQLGVLRENTSDYDSMQPQRQPIAFL